ncbi:LOW QUALITY PROTEIN: hypothetical protein MXB_142 [Myxobolus squamalis]|nr:LOW QUALITY PROTEIN: hypothetical protein MXB_142 [Myxobolus squamalis]
MLVKEFRIPMPLTVEEYKLGQIYYQNKLIINEMQAKSGSIKSITKDEEYLNESGIRGLYSKKHYCLKENFPSVLQFMVSNDASLCEEIWNEYPYTRTKEFLRISLIYRNKYSLISYINVETIDLSSHEPQEATHPWLDTFTSSVSGRGPLIPGWLDAYHKNCIGSSIMCAYKLVTISCNYPLIRTKAESLLLEQAKKRIIEAHSRIWMAQDEWLPLSYQEASQWKGE